MAAVFALSSLLPQEGASTSPRSSFEELWLLLDRDGDGLVAPYEGAEAFLFLADEVRGEAATGLSAKGVDAFLRRRRESEVEERVEAFIEFDRNQDQELEPHELPEILRASFDRLDANGDGVVPLEELLAAGRLDFQFDEEEASFAVRGSLAVMRGVIGPSTPGRVLELLIEEPQVGTIVMANVPGSIDDDSCLRAARMVRRAGLATHVPSGGEVASGGTDFFLAGIERTVDEGARLGVHSWAGFDEEGSDLPEDHPEHERYLAYYRDLGIDESFYWFTLRAAPAESIHFMRQAELRRYGMLTESPSSSSEDHPDGFFDRLFGSRESREPWLPPIPSGPDPLGPIDIGSDPGGIVTLPAGIDPRIADWFTRYTHILAPNGKPIRVLAQDGWSYDGIRRVRSVLEHLLADVPGSRYGSDKSAVANAMADRRATMVLFNEVDAMERAFDGSLGEVELGFQDLRANECPVEGDPDYMAHDTRDAAFEEILHLVHDYGLRPTFPEYDAAIHEANLAMQSAGDWEGWPEDEPENHRNEYFAAIYDNYLDLWSIPPTRYEGEILRPEDLPPGTSHFGTYAHGSRAALAANDPDGFALVEQFLPPHLAYEARLPKDFKGLFSLRLDPALRYTAKSQHLTRVRASGSYAVELRGNGLDNVLTGGGGDDLIEGFGGNDHLVGGSGVDVAFFRGLRTDYVIEVSGALLHVRDQVTERDGRDTLESIETLQFADGTVPAAAFY